MIQNPLNLEMGFICAEKKNSASKTLLLPRATRKWPIGHLPVPKTLSFKTSPSALVEFNLLENEKSCSFQWLLT